MGKLKEKNQLFDLDTEKKVMLEDTDEIERTIDIIEDEEIVEKPKKKKGLFGNWFRKRQRVFDQEEHMSLEEVLGETSFQENKKEEKEVANEKASSYIEDIANKIEERISQAVEVEPSEQEVSLENEKLVQENIQEEISKNADLAKENLSQEIVVEEPQLENRTKEIISDNAEEELETQESFADKENTNFTKKEEPADTLLETEQSATQDTQESKSGEDISHLVDEISQAIETAAHDDKTFETKTFDVTEALEAQKKLSDTKEIESNEIAENFEIEENQEDTQAEGESLQEEDGLPVPTEEPEEEIGLVGQGFTSEVYMYDEDTVLKLYREGFDHQICEREFHTTTQVYNATGITPKPHEITYVEGRVGAVYEYLPGKSMQKELLSKFWSIKQQAKVLAKLHCEMQTQTEYELITVKDKLKQDIEGLYELTEREKLKLYKIIDELPDGNTLCHFDLRPNNVIYKNNVPYAIDWANACIGDPLADVARTTILLRYGRERNQKFYMNLGLKILQSKMVTHYHREYLMLTRRNAKDIEQWDLPIMAARIGEPIAQEEKELLIALVKRQLQFKSIH